MDTRSTTFATDISDHASVVAAILVYGIFLTIWAIKNLSEYWFEYLTLVQKISPN